MKLKRFAPYVGNENEAEIDRVYELGVSLIFDNKI